MDRSYLVVYKIRLSMVSPLRPRERKPPPLNVFLMQQENGGSNSSNERVVQSYVTGDFPDDEAAVENYTREVYQHLINGGKNDHMILDSALTCAPKEQKRSVSKKRGAGSRNPKTKPKNTTKETKKPKDTTSRVKAPKNVKPPRAKNVLRATQIRATSAPTLSFLASLSADAPKGKCHPDALEYKLDFKNKKQELCQKLFQLYNKKVFDNKLPHDLQMNWSKRLNKSAGFTYNIRATEVPEVKPRSSRIAFSTKVCDTADRLRDVLIHELCHAACWLVDELKNGHGNRWKFWVKKAMATFPELPNILRCHDYEIFTKYSYKCVSCGYTIGRHSKSLNTAVKRCGYCYGTFELFANTRKPSGAVSRTKVRDPNRRALSRSTKDN